MTQYKWVGQIVLYDPLIEERSVHIEMDTLFGWYKEFVNTMAVLDAMEPKQEILRVFCRRTAVEDPEK